MQGNETEGIVKVPHRELLPEMGKGVVERAFEMRRPQFTGKKMDMSPGVKGGDMRTQSRKEVKTC